MKSNPCSSNCESMQWFVDNTDVFAKNESGIWIATWVELNRNSSTMDVNKYGIAVHYCIFCGSKINGQL